ncbi:hypothetical protein [Primorskyibacter sp. 2E233]|uniref:hypothetical protein n=1 Tax=Primorskyibacter sp. 2E233 TaxID=3413431 RepID=UPI003BF3DAEF
MLEKRRYRIKVLFAMLLVAAFPGPVAAEEDIDLANFSQPKMMRGLETGNFDYLELSEGLKTNIVGSDLRPRYLYAAFEAFKQFGANIPGDCWKLDKPGVSNGLLGKLVVTSASPEAVTNVLERLRDYAEAIQSGQPVSVLIDSSQRAGSIQSVDESAVYDMKVLLDSHDCESPVTKRVLDNIAAYANGWPGRLSPAEAARQAEEREKEALRQEKAQQLAFRDNARSRCIDQFSKTKLFDRENLCGCIVGALDTGGLSDAEWITLEGDFKEVVAISASHGDTSERVISCLAN